MRFVEAHMDWQARRFAQREAALAGSVRSNSLPEQNCSRVHWSGTRSTKARAVTLATLLNAQMGQQKHQIRLAKQYISRLTSS